MLDQQSALSLVGAKVLVSSFPCLDSVFRMHFDHNFSFISYILASKNNLELDWLTFFLPLEFFPLIFVIDPLRFLVLHHKIPDSRC